MTCAPFVNLVKWKIWKRSKRICWMNQVHVEFKERQSNKGDIHVTLVRKLKSNQIRVMEKSRMIVRLHIAVVHVIMLQKTLIAMWHRCCAKIILNKNSFMIPLFLKPWQFELYVWSSLLVKFRVRNRNYLLVRFIFRISGATLMVFLWLEKNRAYFGSAQNTQLLEVFFSRTDLLGLAVVDSLKKRLR